MGVHIELGRMAKKLLSKEFDLIPLDLGDDAVLTYKKTTLKTEAYFVEGVGKLCLLSLKTGLGAIRMETVSLTPINKDEPLFNLDWMNMVGKETLICELYDTGAEPCPDDVIMQWDKVTCRDSEIKNSSWERYSYHDHMLPCTYHKTGRGFGKIFTCTAYHCLQTLTERLVSAPDCSIPERTERVHAFAEELFEANGPAVSTIKKNFDEETARRLIFDYMYV